MEIIRRCKSVVGEEVQQEANRVCPREVDVVRGQHGLEQLLHGLLGIESDDLVGNGFDRLERTDSSR